jgi:hypothetical protein
LRRPLLNWVTRNNAAALAAFTGDLDRAEQLATEAMELGHSANLTPSQVIGVFGVVLYQIRMAQGRIDELVPLLEERVNGAPDVPVWRVALAGALAESERSDEALVHHLWLAEDGCANVPRDVEYGVTIAGLGRQAYRLRPPKPIMRDVYERLLPFAGLFNWSGPTITDPNDLGLAMCAAALGQPGDADRHFADAVALCDRAGARSYSARCHFFWAQVLADRGDSARAREEAEIGIRMGTEMGMTGPHGAVVRGRAILDSL